MINGDSYRIEQVFSNLISNAIKYGNGSPILITLEEKKGKACLSIQDEGIGIAADKLNKIFDRYERAIKGGKHQRAWFRTLHQQLYCCCTWWND
jgi:signal transduction histidine kinase